MSPLSVYCGRLWAGESESLARRPHPPPSHNRWRGPTGLSGFTRLLWANVGLSAPQDAEGQSCTRRDVGRRSPGLGARMYSRTELHGSPTPSPRSLAFLAKTQRAFKRNFRVSVLAKLPCLSVSVYRARPSPGSVSKASPSFYKQ